MRVLSVIVLLTTLTLPIVALAEVQTFTATHIYILGDHDSKDDARQRCLLETKRKILEQAEVYIESTSEVENFDITKDTITSFASAVMQAKDTKENCGFENGHTTLTLKLIAQIDLAGVRKQLAARQVDASVRDDVAAQKERLKRLEAQLEAMQNQQQDGQSSGHASDSPPINISAEDLQALHTQAAQGDAEAQFRLGMLYEFGRGVPRDFVQTAKWYEKAAAQGDPDGQLAMGAAYENGVGVPQDYVRAYMWFNLALARVKDDAQEFFIINRNHVTLLMPPAQIVDAKRLTQQCQARQFKGC